MPHEIIESIYPVTFSVKDRFGFVNAAKPTFSPNSLASPTSSSKLSSNPFIFSQSHSQSFDSIASLPMYLT